MKNQTILCIPSQTIIMNACSLYDLDTWWWLRYDSICNVEMRVTENKDEDPNSEVMPLMYREMAESVLQDDHVSLSLSQDGEELLN